MFTRDSLISEDLCAGGGRETKQNLKGNELSRKLKRKKRNRKLKNSLPSISSEYLQSTETLTPGPVSAGTLRGYHGSR